MDEMKDFKVQTYDHKVDGDVELIKIKLLQQILIELQKLNAKP